jgi:hypothetical protein
MVADEKIKVTEGVENRLTKINADDVVIWEPKESALQKNCQEVVTMDFLLR